MGEQAEIALFAEMQGLDPEDAVHEFYRDSEPSRPVDIAFDARLLLHEINSWGDEDEPPTTAELLQSLFPQMSMADAGMVAEGLQILARFADG